MISSRAVSTSSFKLRKSNRAARVEVSASNDAALRRKLPVCIQIALYAGNERLNHSIWHIMWNTDMGRAVHL
jgi:hypothetical protein